MGGKYGRRAEPGAERRSRYDTCQVWPAVQIGAVQGHRGQGCRQATLCPCRPVQVSVDNRVPAGRREPGNLGRARRNQQLARGEP
jgi:hypothetical protein